MKNKRYFILLIILLSFCAAKNSANAGDSIVPLSEEDMEILCEGGRTWGILYGTNAHLNRMIPDNSIFLHDSISELITSQKNLLANKIIFVEKVDRRLKRIIKESPDRLIIQDHSILGKIFSNIVRAMNENRDTQNNELEQYMGDLIKKIKKYFYSCEKSPSIFVKLDQDFCSFKEVYMDTFKDMFTLTNYSLFIAGYSPLKTSARLCLDFQYYIYKGAADHINKLLSEI